MEPEEASGGLPNSTPPHPHTHTESCPKAHFLSKAAKVIKANPVQAELRLCGCPGQFLYLKSFSFIKHCASQGFSRSPPRPPPIPMAWQCPEGHSVLLVIVIGRGTRETGGPLAPFPSPLAARRLRPAGARSQPHSASEQDRTHLSAGPRGRGECSTLLPREAPRAELGKGSGHPSVLCSGPCLCPGHAIKEKKIS